VSCGTLQVAHTHLWVGGCARRAPAGRRKRASGVISCTAPGLKGLFAADTPRRRGEPVFRDLKVNAACGFRPVRTSTAAAAGWLAARTCPHPALLTLSCSWKKKKSAQFPSHPGPSGWGNWRLWRELKSCSTPESLCSCNILCLRVQLLS
jgi:hypothetical protein